MKTISQDEFVEFMSEALPDLIASIMREDQSAVSQGRMSVPQFWALHYIARQEGLTVNELAHAMNRGKSTTSALLQRLEAAGWVERSRSATDQRIVNISLTRSGRRLIDQVVENRKQGIRNTYAELTADERSQYRRILDKVVHRLRKSQAILLLAGLAATGAFAQETTNRYSLADSVRLGLRQSVAVVNAARQREIAKTTQQEALADAWPTLTGVADYSLYDTDNLTESGSKTLGAQATWTVFSGGKTLSAIRAAKTYRALTAYTERRIRETQVRDIILAYYEVQLAVVREATLEQSVKQLADFEQETRNKYDAGAASEFDWLGARVSLANERPRCIQAKNDLRLARERFRNLVYLEDDAFVLTEPLAQVPLQTGLDEAIAAGLSRRPELLEKAGAVELRREAVKQQRSGYYPNIDLFANYHSYDPDPYGFLPGSATSSGWQAHWSAGARASWTLFDGGRRKANLGESKLELAIEEDEYRDLLRAVSLDIRTQWLRSRDAEEAIAATGETIELAERALAIARTRFDAGLGTRLEVTQANLERGNAGLGRAQALYEHEAAVARLKHAAGILLEEYEDE